MIALAIEGGQCTVCGLEGSFEHVDRPLRENYACSGCRATLRYRHQAAVLISLYQPEAHSLAELAVGPELTGLDVYEPGTMGPLRRYLRAARSYASSGYWPGVEPGSSRGDMRCEDLQALTFPDDSFDLVVSSDILEHVRRPWEASREVLRVLRPGGRHVFTVPMRWPLPSRTRARVDTSGPDDLHILEPVYHLPLGPGGLVYTEFGMDLPEHLRAIGFEVAVYHGYRSTLTFVAMRPRCCG